MFSSISIERYSIFQYFLNYWNAAADSNIIPAIAYEMQKESYGHLNVIWTKNLWDRNELDFICEKINRGLEYLNPSLFLVKNKAILTI